jgi:hypothetical protein
MTRKIPLTLALAALVGFAAPALAAETHAAKHDPQVAATTAKPTKHAAAKSTPVKGRQAKSSKAKAANKPATQAATTPATK